MKKENDKRYHVNFSTEKFDGFEYFKKKDERSKLLLTFACESGRDRKADLSRSISAYLRGKLLEGEGWVNLVGALKEMPANVGYT